MQIDNYVLTVIQILSSEETIASTRYIIIYCTCNYILWFCLFREKGVKSLLFLKQKI